MIEKAINNPNINQVTSEAWKYKLEHMISENIKELQQ